MAPFSILRSQTLTMESRPRPGPGGTHYTEKSACQRYASVLSRQAALSGVSVLSESELAKVEQVLIDACAVAGIAAW